MARPKFSAGIPTGWEAYSLQYDRGAKAIMGGLNARDLGFALTQVPEYLGQDANTGFAPEPQNGNGNGRHRNQPDMPYPEPKQRDDLDFVPRKGSRPTPF